MSEDKKSLTASELLMSVLQEFGESEGRKVLIVYYNEAKEMCFKSNVEVDHQLVGLAVCVTDRIRDLVREGWKG